MDGHRLLRVDSQAVGLRGYDVLPCRTQGGHRIGHYRRVLAPPLRLDHAVGDEARARAVRQAGPFRSPQLSAAPGIMAGAQAAEGETPAPVERMARSGARAVRHDTARGARGGQVPVAVTAA